MARDEASPARPAGGRPPAAVLAIDAGNSKTDAALVTADGRVLGTGRAGGFQPPATGVEAAVDVLARAVAGAVEAAGFTATAAGFAAAVAGEGAAGTGERAPGRPGPPAAHVSACLANVDLPVEEVAARTAVAARGWGRSTEVANDVFALLRAGTDEPRGVAVVCGAGINCAGTAPGARTARFPALGALSGDLGGGRWLAEQALWFAVRAEDGRGEPTALADAVPAHFGHGGTAELVEALHLRRLDPGRLHELVPVLLAVAAGGDAVARAVVHRQAEEIVTLAVVALRRLGLLAEETTVVLGGGVLAARHPVLHDRVTELLAERAPKAVPRVVTAPPVLGAALLGLDHLAAPPAAHARLRAHFAPAAG
ncbi:N-acetylglucosamine kinase [Streptomyces zingiberis]|uniref:ATPase n=1 Tax=Streptomyces zingiberis TaxID=2053010 RepID=A0ABX1C619_9ACTN|nr:BadF/BadG/BcrA/BcrD ATPase family protein [Streptomyces zingiberis]NJQ03387.1 ATPase [Streptomyces zingiberis]